MNYIESDIEQGIDRKNLFNFENIPNPSDFQEKNPKHYVDNKLNGPGIITDSANDDFIDKFLDTVRFVRVDCLPAVREHLTPKLYVDQSFGEPKLVRNNENNDFNKIFQNNMTVNSKFWTNRS